MFVCCDRSNRALWRMLVSEPVSCSWILLHHVDDETSREHHQYSESRSPNTWWYHCVSACPHACLHLHSSAYLPVYLLSVCLSASLPSLLFVCPWVHLAHSHFHTLFSDTTSSFTYEVLRDGLGFFAEISWSRWTSTLMSSLLRRRNKHLRTPWPPFSVSQISR